LLYLFIFVENQSLFIVGLIGLFLLFILAIIFSFVFWILMIVDCAKRNMKSDDRIVWILILVFLGIIGAVVYYFVVKRRK